MEPSTPVDAMAASATASASASTSASTVPIAAAISASTSRPGRSSHANYLGSRVGWQRHRKAPWPIDTDGQGRKSLAHHGPLDGSHLDHQQRARNPFPNAPRLASYSSVVSAHQPAASHSLASSQYNRRLDDPGPNSHVFVSHPSNSDTAPQYSALPSTHCYSTAFLPPGNPTAASLLVSDSDHCSQGLTQAQGLIDLSTSQQPGPSISQADIPASVSDFETDSVTTQHPNLFGSLYPAPASWCPPTDEQSDESQSSHSSSMVPLSIQPQPPPAQASGQMEAAFNPMKPRVLPYAIDSVQPELDFAIFNSQQYGLVNAPVLDQGFGQPQHGRARTNSDASPKTKRASPMDDGQDPGQEEDGNGDNDGGQENPRKRARGRPRLDTKDETAADRRRTQIRLAQRAYRHRKDTAITTLEQKVKDLEKANSSVTKQFGQLLNSVMVDGSLDAAPHIAQQLKSFAASLKKATTSKGSSNSSVQSDDDGNTKRPVTSGSGAQPLRPHAQQQQQHRGNKANVTQPSIHMPASLSYEVVTQPTPDNASFPFYSSMEARSPKTMGPSIYASLPPPSSFAAHEVTFGRRMQRANCEAGLRLITMKNPPAQRYAAVFGFCLFFEPREAIIERLKLTLSRTELESLSYWRAPFTNLGGAGTFMMDEKAGIASRPDGINLPFGNQRTREFGKQPDGMGFSMGPFGPHVEETREDRLDPRLRMLLPGFEGDFFDSDEVEVYLRKLGITIPRSVDFVEADISLGELEEDGTAASHGSISMFPADQTGLGNSGLAPSDSGYGSVSGPTGRGWSGNSPETEYRMMPPSTPQKLATQSMMPAPHMMAPPPFASGVAGGGRDLNSGFGAFVCPSATNDAFQSMWQTPVWPRTRVTIDVNKLIDELVHKSVCLVRCPGVRRKDVNRALKVAAGLCDNP